MNVNDGFWLTAKGYEVTYATQIYSATDNGSSFTLITTGKWIHNRGMTLEGPLISVTFSSPRANCIKVSIEHFRSGDKLPRFDICADSSFKPVVRKNENGGYELISGATRVSAAPVGSAWEISYYYGEYLLTKCGWRSTSMISEDSCHASGRRQSDHSRFFARTDNGSDTYMREMLSLSTGEYIYGFGEKFTPFVKNGQSVKIWNSDGGTCTAQSYKSVPFCVSSRGYGIFAAHPELVEFEVATENVSKLAFSVQGEKLEYYLLGGRNIAEVISRYTDLTGKPALPPAYTFGLWLSTSFTTSYDEKTVTSFIDEMEHRNIPLDVFHFDCFWMKEFQWCGFEWDRDMFPDPQGMIKRLKDRGLKICLWINPYISQQAPCFGECLENGYFLRNKDGSIFQCDMWQPGLAIIDFTNPAAREWYASKIKQLAADGIDAFKTDFGERIPTDVVWYDGSDPFKMHNYYSYIYNKTVFDAIKEVRGEDNACVFARSATAGCQQFPVHWGGDCFSNYESMYETLRGGLSLCMSGFGFFSHDISGFESTGSPDLYKRWTAFGLLSTHSRYHGSASYRVPWNFDEESCDVARFFVNLKGRLMPYLWRNAILTHKTGVPMMRAMAIDYSFDRSTLPIDTQYMLGDSLLVAPVFSSAGECEFYLPDCGTWTDILTDEELEGGKWYIKKYDYFSLPLLAKPDSIIVFGNFTSSADYDYADNMHIVIYGLGDGNTAETQVYSSDQSLAAVIKAVRRGDTVTVTVSGTNKPFTVESVQGLEVILS